MERAGSVNRLTFLLSFSLFCPSQFHFSQFLRSSKRHESFAVSYAAFFSRLRISFAVSYAAPIPDNLLLSLPIIPGLPVMCPGSRTPHCWHLKRICAPASCIDAYNTAITQRAYCSGGNIFQTISDCYDTSKTIINDTK